MDCVGEAESFYRQLRYQRNLACLHVERLNFLSGVNVVLGVTDVFSREFSKTEKASDV